jgi:hypothetical protein
VGQRVVERHQMRLNALKQRAVAPFLRFGIGQYRSGG